MIKSINKIEKKIQDYLPYYLGCRVIAAPYGGQSNRWEVGEFIGINILNVAHIKLDNWQSIADISCSCVKPILRKPDSITDEEIKESIGTDNYETSFPTYSPSDFVYLLSRHFDLFGLIESGLAIDAATLPK